MLKTIKEILKNTGSQVISIIRNIIQDNLTTTMGKNNSKIEHLKKAIQDPGGGMKIRDTSIKMESIHIHNSRAGKGAWEARGSRD